MKIKLKESIRAKGVQYRPPAVVDIDKIGITQADADVLVRRGTAEVVEEAAPVEGTLSDMKKDELVALASEMGIETSGKTKAELVAAIESEKADIEQDAAE